MVRPKLATDDEILDAASLVMARRGLHGFTVTEVASEIGLSRAAIVLRFKSAEELKSALTIRMVAPLLRSLDAIPPIPGGDGLIAVARCVGRHVGSREGSARFFVGLGRNMTDRTMAGLERSRGDVLKQALDKVMPTLCIGRDAAVALFRAHLAGSVLAWLSADGDDPETFLMDNTRKWLTLMGIPFSGPVEPMPVPARIKRSSLKR